jgi:hypothetical protein
VTGIVSGSGSGSAGGHKEGESGIVADQMNGGRMDSVSACSVRLRRSSSRYGSG